MLTLYHSNRLDVLRELLVELIRRDPLTNPLEDEQILVQSPGMARWLQLEVAEAFGIAASIEFPLPATFIWKMFIQILDDVPDRSAFAKDSMTWKLMGLLPQWLEDERFAPLKRYLENDEDKVRRYQLAGKIADIFDQYLVYRPEWIADWEAGNDRPELTSDQSWQPALWRALVETTRELEQSHWHRANMHQSFAAALKNGHFRGKLPKRLFVFGISALPPGYVEALHALGEQCDVHLMITNPCRYYWGDIRDARYLAMLDAKRFKEGVNPEQPESLEETGNPLLASMGKLGRDYLYQLQELGAAEIDAFADIDRDSLLHCIQSDILELQDSTNQKHSIATEDTSLSFHGCHSPLREVEVLHDHLLSLFDKNPELKPRDIIVMVPDIDSYAPFLQAVFGSASGERYIPFALSDRSAAQEHPVLAALNRLMTLDQSRASGPELLELLEVKAMQSRFELDADDLATLQHWIEDAGIRWGLNPEHQARFDIPKRTENTWLFGLRRMLLGYAMPASQGIFHDVMPSDLVQGMNAELAGKLADFIESCEWLVTQLDKARNADNWTLFLNQLLERFFLPDSDDEQVLQRIRQALETFRQQLTDARFEEPLPRAVMVDWLQENLDNTRNSQRFLAGQVNICTLMPMRSIPFKVVCLLGMNDSAYPRSLPPMGFDLMAKDPRRGDRSRREDDRYLFLEALLSARESLYISYVSRNIRDNTERFPSVLVTELQNLIRESFVTDDGKDGSALVKNLFTQHSLQAFSSANFMADNLERSFAREWLPAAEGKGEPAQPFLTNSLPELNRAEDGRDDIELPLAKLITFWNNPCQAFCQQRLKVFFDDELESAETREPFALSGLTGWQLKDSLVRQYLEHGSDQTLGQQAQATGILPHGHFGRLAIKELKSDATNLAGLVEPWLKNRLSEDLEVNLLLNDSRLTGWLTEIHRHGQVFWRTGKLREKHRFSAWIQHLCFCASTGVIGKTYYLTQDELFAFTPVNPEEALSMLSDLERLMQQGLTRPLPFFQRTAWAWIQETAGEIGLSDDESVLESANDKASKTFYGTGFGPAGECTDAYIQRCWPELEPALNGMSELIRQILQPLYAHYQKIDKEALPE
ncbi:exodeoxyribonuclease V subunit gamma [Sansalvadorimonas sp. 2012CJ34-2]|uniref:RecBCD enzyme subunit RecC n=1 Tax=Parendozoicomonas callyspongiae TaxID=2942213 RepID=A0ABT0PKP0_9GAMM|nr:exodeoxyribonuclease V subunit gamma [Sansalvadorimonas sp. 2012CJ34-2]MCL6271836.1 exodeoxyribonuclease V subunit gamma [Sansalvadorimonas sp. 2012CJ34-2]